MAALPLCWLRLSKLTKWGTKTEDPALERSGKGCHERKFEFEFEFKFGF